MLKAKAFIVACALATFQLAPADASAVWLEPPSSASFAAPACSARRFFDSGAHTTRHEIEQSSGTEQLLWSVNSTLSSPLSAWLNDAQVEIDLVPRSARATGTQSERARAEIAHRVQQGERIAQTSGDGARRRGRELGTRGKRCRRATAGAPHRSGAVGVRAI